ncbi:hypothetical protein [Nocardia sp. R6R-6]|uniref:hypothetical protein n=1 Tax=Nocardia sp. R6R-6 TaxID=3459303 RepID=UPI00403E063C
MAYVPRLLAAERVLTCWWQALLLVVWFRKQEDLAVLGAGLGIGRATSCRYRGRDIDLKRIGCAG